MLENLSIRETTQENADGDVIGCDAWAIERPGSGESVPKLARIRHSALEGHNDIRTNMSKPTATLIGFGAVLLWALLALFTAANGDVPPFQLSAMSFAIGGAAGASTWLYRPHGVSALKQDWPVWLLGVGGLFGYHFFYFSALRAAPPVGARHATMASSENQSVRSPRFRSSASYSGQFLAQQRCLVYFSWLHLGY